MNGAQVGARTPLAEGDVIGWYRATHRARRRDSTRFGLAFSDSGCFARPRVYAAPLPGPAANEPDTAQMAAPIETRRPADQTDHWTQSRRARRMSTDASTAPIAGEVSSAQRCIMPTCQSRRAMTDASRAAAEAQTQLCISSSGVCVCCSP